MQSSGEKTIIYFETLDICGASKNLICYAGNLNQRKVSYATYHVIYLIKWHIVIKWYILIRNIMWWKDAKKYKDTIPSPVIANTICSWTRIKNSTYGIKWEGHIQIKTFFIRDHFLLYVPFKLYDKDRSKKRKQNIQ